MPALFLLPLLFLTGLTAGLVDSIAGGGGLITIPILLGVIMPVFITMVLIITGKLIWQNIH